jgi:hypothetical protein
VSGRDARDAYDRAKQRQTDRTRAIENWEREQDAREDLAP